MAYRMTITLTDQEYALLAAEAAKKGEQPETLLHEIMLQRLQSPSQIKHPMTEQEFEEKLYSEGKILNIPMRRPLTPKNKPNVSDLLACFQGGKLASEMVMEDRGPY